MRDVVLNVRHSAGGWWVDCDLPLEPTCFRSGARAEAVARKIAQGLSEAGHDVRVVISDRGDRLVATRRYFAN